MPELNPADACPSLHERQPLPRTDDAQDDVLDAGFIQRDELVVDSLGRADQRAGHVGRAGLGIGEDVRTADWFGAFDASIVLCRIALRRSIASCLSFWSFAT
jgi:hypothetical protein